MLFKKSEAFDFTDADGKKQGKKKSKKKLIVAIIAIVLVFAIVAMDSKIGVQSLVKRILIGMAGILLLPTIFNMSISLQQGILSDNLFGEILLTETQLREYERNKHQMGRVLAFNVYQAFWNIDANQVPQKYVNDYKEAVNAKDPEVFGDINEESGGEFVIDYFPILSTVVLFFVAII